MGWSFPINLQCKPNQEAGFHVSEANFSTDLDKIYSAVERAWEAQQFFYFYTLDGKVDIFHPAHRVLSHFYDRLKQRVYSLHMMGFQAIVNDGSMTLVLKTIGHVDQFLSKRGTDVISIQFDESGRGQHEQWGKWLKQTPQIQTLSLEHASLGVWMSSLTNVLPQLTQLETLELMGNKLGDQGTAHIVEACRDLPRLKCLRLEMNGMTSQGLESIASVSWTALQHLSLYFNNLSFPEVRKKIVLNSQRFPQLLSVYMEDVDRVTTIDVAQIRANNTL